MIWKSTFSQTVYLNYMLISFNIMIPISRPVWYLALRYYSKLLPSNSTTIFARTYLQPHYGNVVFRQCLPFSWTALRGKYGQHPIAVMGVVATFGLCWTNFVCNPTECYILLAINYNWYWPSSLLLVLTKLCLALGSGILQYGY